MISRSRKNRGFSLIELLCSMAIGSFILLAAAALLGASGDGYQRVGGGVAAEREARALITQLTADLSTARFHKDSIFGKSPEPWPADHLGFLSLQSADAQSETGRIGDLCAVGYSMMDLTSGGKTIRCLRRVFRESGDTFEALADGNVASLFSARDQIDEPVAFGVVAFQARPKSRDKSGQWIDWVKNDQTPPKAIEVRLVIARRGLATKLVTPADWDGAGDLLGNPVLAHRNKELEVYETLIRFGNDEHP